MKKVMLIEDDRTMCSLLRTLLLIEGVQVHSSEIGTQQSIVESIIQFKPDTLLLDFHLKKANGLEILKKIRKIPSLISLRIFMVSGMDLEDQCVYAGADGFFLKPYNPEDLINSLCNE
jgi:two-component system, cell cycle response regulator